MPARFLLAVLFAGCLTGAAVAEDIRIVVDKPLGVVGQTALDELTQALKDRGDKVAVAAEPGEEGSRSIVVGVAGQSSVVDRIVAEKQIRLPKNPESLVVQQDGKQLLIAGRDARGLVYALRDATRSIELAPKGKSGFEGFVLSGVESPTLAVRNVSIHLFNADLERSWYFAEEFWRDYFRMLSLYRFNHFTLTFCDQTNYLCPPYAYLVEMPEYPQVKVEKLTAEGRKRNLAMLRRIAELADTYGIDFNLGIWMQAPVERWSAPVRVTGLPEGLAAAEYCALGLRRVLEACPSIRGVQLRMNEEAGVPAEQQTDFYHPMFQAIRQVGEASGRPIRLDLRYKGLQPSTTKAAVDEKLDVTVSTKFWAEHFGLPYHPTSVDSHWREDRYSFGAMLAKPRSYKVVYQLWNVGSQRLTIWGDPVYARRFAESCQLGGGEGFEVFAPLTNRGYGDKPGDWSVIKDPKYRVGRWDQERYWFFYLCFGRMGYNPRTNPEVWQREFRHRFGRDADQVEKAYATASQVLPFITATRLPGASEWSWWPEMDTGGPLSAYMDIQPSDPRQFYAIRSWRRSPDWRWEDWDHTPGYVDDVQTGTLQGKWTPWQIADHLQRVGERTVPSEISQLPPDAGNELRITHLDFQLLAHLALYHAHKLRAATYLALFEVDGQTVRLELAEKSARQAQAAWERIVSLTEPVYHQSLVFGITADSPRSKLGHNHAGHWKDRLVEVARDVEMLIEQRSKLPVISKTKSFAGLPSEPEIAFDPFTNAPVEKLEKDYRRVSQVVPQPFGKWRQDGSFDLRVTVNPGLDKPKRVVLHYRPLDQTRDWRSLEMQTEKGRSYLAVIAADQIDQQFDLQYYIEVQDSHGGQLWPSWKDDQPYIVVPVRSKPEA